jgi:hypothetical protein
VHFTRDTAASNIQPNLVRGLTSIVRCDWSVVLVLTSPF